MSTEQSISPEVVEETKAALRSLVNEIEELSRSDVEVREFYEGFLNRVVTAMAALGGAVWTLGSGGRLELGYQNNIRETQLTDTEENQIRHGHLLRKVITTGEGQLVAPQSGDDKEGNPTDCLLVLGCLKSDQQVEGVLEIFQRPGARGTVERGYLRFVLQMCDVAGEYLKTRRLRHFTDRQTLWSRLESFTRTAHQSLDPKATSYTIANEGRRLIECDRVSVAIRRGNHCRIEAVSGQEIFDKRSNTVTLLGELSSAVCKTGEEVWYTGDTANLPPQVEEALQNYIDDSHSKMVAVLPLRRPMEDENDENEKQEPVIGALIVEQIEETRLAEGLKQRVTVVADHSSTALANAMQHNSLFLMPLWRSLGNASWVVKGRTLPKTLLILGAVLAFFIGIFIIPADFNLSARGSLEPVIKQDVFANEQGTITEVLVKHGQYVTKGTKIAQLRNSQLDIEMQKVSGDLDATTARIGALERLIEKEKDAARKEELRGQRMEAIQNRNSLTRQKSLYEKKQQDLEVLAPIDGNVVTWDVYDKLIARPVEKGQVLMQIANQQGEWQLEIHMPEDRMGFIKDARQSLKDGEEQEVTYILATDPSTKRKGKVREIHAAAEVKGEEGNVVLIKVAIDKSEIPDLRPGATVTAKVYSGRASLGYTWFHDLISFVQSKILFRL